MSPPNTKPDVIDELANDTKTKDQIANDSLQAQLQAEKDLRLEDRFVFCVIILILIDIILLNGAINSWLAILVLVFEIIILFAIAKRMGVEKIDSIMNRMLGAVSGTNNSQK